MTTIYLSYRISSSIRIVKKIWMILMSRRKMTTTQKINAKIRNITIKRSQWTFLPLMMMMTKR